MKKLFTISLLFIGLLTSFNTIAQSKGTVASSKGQTKTPEEMAELRSQFWKKELGLNDDQTTQMKTAINEKITKFREAKANTDKAAKKTAMVAAKDNFQSSVKGILNEEQLTKFNTKKEDMKKKAQAAKAKKKSADSGIDEIDETY